MILVSTFLWGLFAHGMTLFNKYSFHDDAGLFTVGQTFNLGRWMLGIFDLCGKWLSGSSHYSTPLFYGVITILCVAVCSILIVDLLELNNQWLITGMCGLMIVFPVLTSTFGYMFTAPHYYVGTLMGVFGGWLSCKYHKWYLYLSGLLLMACGVGVYQANIPVYVSMILLYMIKKTAEKDRAEWAEFFKLSGKSVLSCVGFMVFYFVLNEIALKVTGTELSDYQGINQMGSTSIKGYIKRIIIAYKEFFLPTDGISANMYPFSTDVVYKFLIIIAGIAGLYLLYRCWKKDRFLCLQLIVLTACIPLAVNFIYFMCDTAQVDSMMTYGEVFFFVYLVWILDRFFIPGGKLSRILAGTGLVLLMTLNVMYCRFDNICYLKAEFMQEQAISYFTALSAQIKSTEGFTAETPVVYVNEFEKYDYTMANIPEFKEITLIPYAGSRIINSYSWKVTMKMWCNFDPVCEDAAGYSELPEVLEMPSYPASGSVRMLNNVLIVKF